LNSLKIAFTFSTILGSDLFCFVFVNQSINISSFISGGGGTK
jgi:hypothetical protein